MLSEKKSFLDKTKQIIEIKDNEIFELSNVIDDRLAELEQSQLVIDSRNELLL